MMTVPNMYKSLLNISKYFHIISNKNSHIVDIISP